MIEGVNTPHGTPAPDPAADAARAFHQAWTDRGHDRIETLRVVELVHYVHPGLGELPHASVITQESWATDRYATHILVWDPSRADAGFEWFLWQGHYMIPTLEEARADAYRRVGVDPANLEAAARRDARRETVRARARVAAFLDAFEVQAPGEFVSELGGGPDPTDVLTVADLRAILAGA